MRDKLKFDEMVICSTLNQMVNYIAIQDHGIKNIYNIRLKGKSGKFDYDKWDENLKNALDLSEIKICNDISYGEKEIVNHKNIIKKLEKEFGDIKGKYPMKKKSILWNITGGQRHFVMAITEYVYQNRPKDVIVYYEGDHEKMHYYSKDSKFREEMVLKNKEAYKITIPIALQLMGFKTSERELSEPSKYYKWLIGEEKDKMKSEYTWYIKFYNIYIKNEKLRHLLINSNKFINDKRTIMDKIEEDIKAHIDSKEIIDSEDCFDNFSVLEKSIENYNRGKVFGYILERMTFYNILFVLKRNKALVSNIADIDISVKIKNDGANSDERMVDEFDILILTKKGKVIMLECKSGGMTGDNAKSHNYSTYAVAGVYGTPILINPEDDDNLKNNEHFKTKVDNLSSKEKEDNNNVYKYVISARNAASKVNLDIWSVNKIEDKLKNLLVVGN